MSQLNGIYVDNDGNIKCRLGDSGSIHFTGIPTDDDYKISLAVVNPADGKILNEVSVQSDEGDNVDIPISVSFTTSLGVGRFFYGVKLTDSNGEEQTVSPKTIEEEDGTVSMLPPNIFLVKPLLVEGGQTND